MGDTDIQLLAPRRQGDVLPSNDGSTEEDGEDLNLRRLGENVALLEEGE
jgi:hypothetical protein